MVFRKAAMEGVGERLYRRTFPFMLLDVGILALLLGTHVTIFNPIVSLAAGIGSVIAVLFVIYSAIRFRRLKPGGLNLAMSAFLVLFVLYLFVGLIDLAAAGFTGDSWLLIQSALILLLGRSCLQRRKSLNDPRFRSWWVSSTGEDVLGIELQDGEVLAMCPSCSSMLAVVPEKLELGDPCPICGLSLTGGQR